MTRSSQKRVHQAEVLANSPLGTGPAQCNYILKLKLGANVDAFPGQFVELRLSERPNDGYRPLDGDDSGPWSVVAPDLHAKSPLLNRPFSIAGLASEADSSEVYILYKVRGPGTTALRHCQVGQRLETIGPLGQNGFSLPQGTKHAVLVGGGIGLPPLLFWLDRLLDVGVTVDVVVGARTADELPLPDTLIDEVSAAKPPSLPRPFTQLADSRVTLHLTTDDGTAGTKGLASDALEAILADGPAGRPSVVYGCGPWNMLRSVAECSRDRSVGCQVSLEEMMGCGMGVCQSCIVRIAAASPAGWEYRLVCRDGPVFDANIVIWDR